MRFRWNAWNIDHATRHHVGIREAEAIVARARSPYPEYRGDEKWRVVGRGAGGRLVQVVYLIDVDGAAYIIHARDLTDKEKRRHRKRE